MNEAKPQASPTQPLSEIQAAMDPFGNLYLSDEFNHRVFKFAADGTQHFCLEGKGQSPGQFHYPSGLSIWEGKLAVADRWNHRIQFFDLDGTFIKAIGSYGSALGQFDNPCGLAVDQEGLLWIVDFGNHRLCALHPDFSMARTVGKNSGTSASNLYQISARYAQDPSHSPAPPLFYPRQLRITDAGFTLIENGKLLQIQPNGWRYLQGSFTATNLVHVHGSLALAFKPLTRQLLLLDLLSHQQKVLLQFEEGLLAIAYHEESLLLIGERIWERYPLSASFFIDAATGKTPLKLTETSRFTTFSAPADRETAFAPCLTVAWTNTPSDQLLQHSQAVHQQTLEQIFQALDEIQTLGSTYREIPKRRLFELNPPSKPLHSDLLTAAARQHSQRVDTLLQLWLQCMGRDLQLLAGMATEPQRACDFADQIAHQVKSLTARIERSCHPALQQIRQFTQDYPQSDDPSPFYRADLRLFYNRQLILLLHLYTEHLQPVFAIIGKSIHASLASMLAEARHQIAQEKPDPAFDIAFPRAHNASEAIALAHTDILRLVQSDIQREHASGEAKTQAQVMRQALAYCTERDQLFHVDGDEPALLVSYAVLAVLLYEYGRLGRTKEIKEIEAVLKPYFAENTLLHVDYLRFMASQVDPERFLPALDEVIQRSSQIVASMSGPKHTSPYYYHFNNAIIIKNNLFVALCQFEEANKTLDKIAYSLLMYPHFKARNLFYAYRFEEALEAFRTATKLKHQSPIWRWENDFGIGACMLFLLRYDEAIAHFNDPTLPQAIPPARAACGTFCALRLARRYNEAESMIESYTQTDFPEKHMYHGILMRVQGRYEEAIQAFQQQKIKYPLWLNHFQELATYQLLKDQTRKMACFESLPENAWILWQDVRVPKRDPRFFTALDDYLRVEALDPASLSLEQRKPFYWQLDHLLERNSLNY